MFKEEEALQILSSVKDSGSNRSLLELGWFDKVYLKDSKVTVRLKLPSFAQSQRDRIVEEIKNAFKGIPEISGVQIELSNSSNQGEIGNSGHGEVGALQRIPGVKKILAVSSGKGGVGKSTVAVNLACALSQQGYSVGLLDADIYGPNTPIMLGVSNQTPEVIGSGSEQKIIPIESCGIAMVSMGLLIDENQPVIWRGPMLNGIIRQFLYQADWGERDFLVVDLPPGTGDAQISLAQAVPMSGVLIVTTPQNVSLQDSRRGLAMFKQMNIPILGIIENMSEFITPDNPERKYKLFGEGGGNTLSKEYSLPLLAKLPFEMRSLDAKEESMPIVLQSPDSITSKAFKDLAKVIVENIENNNND